MCRRASNGRAPTLWRAQWVSTLAFGATYFVVTLARAEDIEVVVPGTAIDKHATADATAASTVLRRDELKSPGATSASVLASVPGVEVNQVGSGSDLATASLRGTSSAQTPVYLAGIRLNDDLSGTADLSTVPLWMLDRIEIYRGNAKPGSEPSGIGGAVDFEPRYPTGSETRLGTSLGSFGQRSLYAGLGQGTQHAQGLVAIRRESAQNDYTYYDNGGTAYTAADDRWAQRLNADQSTWDAWALARVQPSRESQVLLLANGFDREQGTPGLLAIPALHARAHIRRELFGLSTQTSLACSKVARCQLASATSFQRASTDLSDMGITNLSSNSNRMSQSATLTWRGNEDWSITPSAGWAAETLRVASVGAESLDAKRTEASAGAFVQWQTSSRLTILGQVRLDTETTQASSTPTFLSQPSGRVGGRYEIASGWNLLTNVGHYHRVPTLGELYGTSAFVVGNASLSPEHGTNIDVGTRYVLQRRPWATYFEAYVFQQDLDQLIAWRRSSFGQIRPYNVGSARLRGVENLVVVEPSAVVRLQSTATLLDPRDTSENRTLRNDILPFRSRLVLDGRVELHTSHPVAMLHLRQVSTSLHAMHRSSRYQDQAGLIIIPQSTTFDVDAAFTLADLPLTLRASLYNLANTPRYDVVGYPLPPRAVALSAELDWERPP